MVLAGKGKHGGNLGDWGIVVGGIMMSKEGTRKEGVGGRALETDRSWYGAYDAQ